MTPRALRCEAVIITRKAPRRSCLSCDDGARFRAEYQRAIRLGDYRRRLPRADGDLSAEDSLGAYRLLHALYGELERDAEIRTVTFAEYILGNAARRIPPHLLD